MKRTIQALLLILTVSLFATSCSKTTRNEIAISGKWELLKTVITEDGQVIYDQYSAQESTRTYFDFNSNGEFVQTIISINGTRNDSGKWIVDDDILVMTFADHSEMYNIDKASLLMIVLSQSYVEDGKKYVRTITLRSDSDSSKE